MAFIEFLEKLRFPLLDGMMLLITELGGEVFLIAFGLVILWCTDKNLGRYMLSVGVLGTVLSQWMKILCRIPRPWVRKAGFTIVEAAREGAGGYSFPSGHSQSAAAVLGCTARWYRKRAVRILCGVLILLVMFSRMYLGVHTPWDVAVGCVLSLVPVFLFYPLFRDGEAGRARRTLLFLLLLSAAYVLFMELFPFPGDTDPDNLKEAVKNARLLLGASLGVYLAFETDERFIRYDTSAVWYVQVVKCLFGLLAVLILRHVLKGPLLALFGGHPAADGARYFILCYIAAGVWPMTFKALSRIGGGRE